MDISMIICIRNMPPSILLCLLVFFFPLKYSPLLLTIWSSKPLNYSPWLTTFTQIYVRNMLPVNSHTVNVLPDTKKQNPKLLVILSKILETLCAHISFFFFHRDLKIKLKIRFKIRVKVTRIKDD